MAFPINDVNGYGTGALGTVGDEIAAAEVNSYAQVTGITTNTITINSSQATLGQYEKFTTGTEILIHVSGSNGDKTYLGKWMVATILSVSGSILRIDKDFTSILPITSFSNYYVQAVTIAQFDTLTLNTGIQLTPVNYSAPNYYGGIIAIKCATALKFNGGHINLVERGIPIANKSIRPIMTQEANGTGLYDTDKYSGWENSITLDRFLLNVGDGAAWVVAKSISCDSNSRIGNVNSYGAQFCRGSNNSVGAKPEGITNIGGSTILMAAESLLNFSPTMISKYRSTSAGAGQGLCRCYIASETEIRNDEALYAYDRISTPSRVMSSFNIKDYGDGTFGDVTNPTIQMNNYARVTAISTDGKRLTYTGKTTAGFAQITSNALLMIHANHKKNTNNTESGKFVLARVLSDTGTVLTLDTSVSGFNMTDYNIQVVSIPQLNNLTVSNDYTATPAYNGYIGGICVIACKGTCNLSNGYINVNCKGGGVGYGTNGLAAIGNAQDATKLPIGQGNGSVLILAKTLIMNNNTRIGATYSGASFGGYGYQKRYGYHNNGRGGGYLAPSWQSTGGSGAGGGLADYDYNGGYGGNGAYRYYKGWNIPTYQGAHILIIADTINGFNQYAISTGGSGKAFDNTGSGGAGYGGGGVDFVYGATGGGYNGGGGGGRNGNPVSGGGSSGWAFIYCNNVVNSDTTGTILAA